MAFVIKIGHEKLQSSRHVVLAEGQTCIQIKHRSEPRNKPIYLGSVDHQRRYQSNSFQQMALRQVDMYILKDEFKKLNSCYIQKLIKNGSQTQAQELKL